MRVNKRTGCPAVQLQVEYIAVMLVLHLVHVTTVELPALILNSLAVWGVFIQFQQLLQQLPQHQLDHNQVDHRTGLHSQQHHPLLLHHLHHLVFHLYPKLLLLKEKQLQCLSSKKETKY